MGIISLNQQLKRIEVSGFEIESEVCFEYFDNLPSAERDDKLLRAIYIGVLAMMEDRLSAFLSKTSNELGTELENLKLLFDMKQELFYKTSVKGIAAEEEIAQFLEEFLNEKKIKDNVSLTGNLKGNLQRNKTGDIISILDSDKEIKIAIECKFDKSVKLGEIESKDLFIRKTDTAWSQLIETQANRDAKVGIIVFDISLIDGSILKNFEKVGYIPSIGFVAIVDSQKGDYSNLAIAYMLARDIALNASEIEFDNNLLQVIVKRIIKDFGEVLTIKKLIESNIDNNRAILKQLEKSLLLAEFNQKYLTQFLKTGTLTKEDLLSFYQGEEIKEKFNLIEKEIENQF
ncbi:MAG: hypothetical protein ABJH08_04165 [Balneola sp.]